MCIIMSLNIIINTKEIPHEPNSKAITWEKSALMKSLKPEIHNELRHESKKTK